MEVGDGYKYPMPPRPAAGAGLTCETCKHFIGAGDWNLCCDLPHPDYPCGFLCYEDTPACDSYEEGTHNWRYPSEIY